MNETTPSTDRPTLTTAERRAILADYVSYERGDPCRGALLRQPPKGSPAVYLLDHEGRDQRRAHLVIPESCGY